MLTSSVRIQEFTYEQGNAQCAEGTGGQSKGQNGKLTAKEQSVEYLSEQIEEQRAELMGQEQSIECLCEQNEEQLAEPLPLVF